MLIEKGRYKIKIFPHDKTFLHNWMSKRMLFTLLKEAFKLDDEMRNWYIQGIVYPHDWFSLKLPFGIVVHVTKLKSSDGWRRL